jgi:hypothetical protein
MADNKKMILNLFGSMQDALFLGDRFANGEFVSFLQPGQFVSTNLIESGNSDDMAIQSEITKTLIDSSYVNKYQDVTYSNSKELLGSVDQVYEDVMLHDALPFEELTPAVLAEIAALQKWVQDNNANYLLYENRYFDAVEAYDFEAHKKHPDGGRLQRLAQKRTDASHDWQTFGLQGLYDRKLARLLYLTSPDPTTFWQSLRDRLQSQKQQSPNRGAYYQTFLIPSISSWANAGWGTFEETISESDTYEYSKSTSWSGGISGGWGLWSFGGGASGSKNFQQTTSDVSSVSLKFDYLRVKIQRTWLTEDVFGYKFWTWNKQFSKEFISDGGNLNVNPPIRPIGRMPVLPRYLIVVRNVELQASFSHNDVKIYNDQVSGHASVGWGPFSASGSYQESTGTKTTQASFDGVTFRIPQPQIIARTGILMPRTPNPDETLSWQDDAWIPNKATFDELKPIRQRDYEEALLEEELIEARASANEMAEAIYQQKRRAIEKVHGHKS